MKNFHHNSARIWKLVSCYRIARRGQPCFAAVLFTMDFSLLTTSGVSQKRNGAVGNTKPPAMRVEDKLLYKKITFPL